MSDRYCFEDWLSGCETDRITLDPVRTRGALKRDAQRVRQALSRLPHIDISVSSADPYVFLCLFIGTLLAGKTPILFPKNAFSADGGEKTASLFLTDTDFERILAEEEGILSDTSATLSPEAAETPLPDCSATSSADNSATSPDVGAANSLDTGAATCLEAPTIDGVCSSDSTFVLFTSGSSGQPKKIVKTIREMDLEAVVTSELLEGVSVEAVASTVDFEHQYGLTFAIWLPMTINRPILSSRIRVPEDLLRVSVSSALVSTPSFLSNLDTALPRVPIRFVLSAGSPLTAKAGRKVHDWLDLEVREIYGSTEAGVMATRETQAGSIALPWTLFRDYEIEDGMLSSRNGRLKTSLEMEDLLEFVDDRRFFLKGRKDKIIKVGEERINLNLIERIVKEVLGYDAKALPIEKGERTFIGVVILDPDLADATSSPSEAAFPINASNTSDAPDASGVSGVSDAFEASRASGASDASRVSDPSGTSDVSCASSASDASRDSDALRFSASETQSFRKRLRARLPLIAVPRFWRRVGYWPLNRQGKLLTKTLKELFDE